MKPFILAAALLLMAIQTTFGQSLKGTVVETGSNNRLPEAFIRNMTNKQIALTDDKGNFEIPAQTGNTLIISSPGYVSDTLYLVDLKTRQIQLTTQSIALREVNITASRNFDPRSEYRQVYQNAKVYALSPSTWFGKDAKNARRLKHYFEREAQERRVDSAFSRAYVGSIIPLKGQELDDFLLMYRPSYEFLRNNNGPSMAVYINDSYRKYMALPPEKRKPQRLMQ
ncbi:carboxypeptidase-like regulatory domain-containing protein [Mucilaginibacter sp. RS28]|uniref:Carboxypeptidase-like regulatory domain-containing protein n=1 Tax=Mucilaginibacter straminoryzae TaxID=2932774 RepID=A0A9X2BBC4_9SPHI|nr:carboxypeptidase-like regulatory domain-containing protein [Mucilaginibacter straminoryzae]MCJ8211650.1 carboxypeptidase-like regulatory domain-containing protein [Mucilaginibacter straminoryzae]